MRFGPLLLKDSASRMKADVIPARPLSRGQKRRLPDTIAHPEHQEERWARRDSPKKSTRYDRNRPLYICTMPAASAVSGPAPAATKTCHSGDASGAAKARSQGLMPAATKTSDPGAAPGAGGGMTGASRHKDLRFRSRTRRDPGTTARVGAGEWLTDKVIDYFVSRWRLLLCCALHGLLLKHMALAYGSCLWALDTTGYYS